MAPLTIFQSIGFTDAAAMSIMKKQGIRHLPVTADGTIIGVLSVADLLRAFEDQNSA
ncbi:MAG: CBS domain-containing protein [Nitrospira sp.]|nr:CBS domain-containing protein [Nitrospira sp.]